MDTKLLWPGMVLSSAAQVSINNCILYHIQKNCIFPAFYRLLKDKTLATYLDMLGYDGAPEIVKCCF